MIKKFALTLFPLVKNAKFGTIKITSLRVPLTVQRNYFTTQKQNHEGQKKPQQNNQKKQNKQEAQKQEKPDIKNQNQQKLRKEKLSKLTNEQLIQMNTEQSLKIVNTNIKRMQEIKQKNDQQLKSLEQRLKSMDKHHSQSVTKQQQLLQNIKQQQEQLQRIKKRADKQIDDSKDYAITKLAKELLEFADSIKRCRIMIQQKMKTSPNDLYYKKIVQIHQELKQFLKLYDIQQFDPINKPFDPNTAEGLVTIPTPPGYQKNNVATTMVTGYKIKQRLLRCAKVGIFI